jgi:phosphoribosylformylglycinamidine cyclo-ligase
VYPVLLDGCQFAGQAAPQMAITYKDAGVDIEAGANLVKRIKAVAGSASRPEVLEGIGGFASLFRLPEGYRDPVLVSGTDGVGTKLKVAFATQRHSTVGIDLVAMAVNDVVVLGAEPLFFLDYFATGKLDPEVGAEVISGVAEGCRQAGCALVGGETAELPGMYADGEYDLAGFCVGVVERERIRDGRDLAEDDALIAIASSGLHSNGLSLARKALLDELGLGYDDRPDMLAGSSIADELLRPTRIYARALAAVPQFKAAAHITGGGLIENPPRFLRDDRLGIVIDTSSWTQPPIFDLIASAGVNADEMRKTFNLGVGMVLACAPDQAAEIVTALDAVGERAWQIGRICRRTPEKPQVQFVAGS